MKEIEEYFYKSRPASCYCTGGGNRRSADAGLHEPGKLSENP